MFGFKKTENRLHQSKAYIFWIKPPEPASREGMKGEEGVEGRSKGNCERDGVGQWKVVKREKVVGEVIR